MTIPVLHLASKSLVKKAAVERVWPHGIECVDVPSDVPPQPQGLDEIVQGARNRLARINHVFAVSIESGISDTHELSYVCLRCPFGYFSTWTDPYDCAVHRPRAYMEWRALSPSDRSYTTLGSIVNKHHADVPADNWYPRARYIERAVSEVFQQVAAVAKRCTYVPASLKDFKGVKFLDIQSVLAKDSDSVMRAVAALTHGVLYDTVVVIDGRGLLFANAVADGRPVVLVRPKGKLPGEVHSVDCVSEYSTKIIEMQKDCIKPGSCVLVVDDVVATGGSFEAARLLVSQAGATVAAYVAPWAIEGLLDSRYTDVVQKVRYAFTDTGLAIPVEGLVKETSCRGLISSVVPPSLETSCTKLSKLDVKWGSFSGGDPNIWFPVTRDLGTEVLVFVNPLAGGHEVLNTLMLLTVLGKITDRVKVIVPFCSFATQDRVEFTKSHQSMAAVDPFARLLADVPMVTYDLHNLATHFTFRRMENVSLVKELVKRFAHDYPHAIPVFPDEGASKRFAPMVYEYLPCEPVVFSKMRVGSARVVTTFNRIETDDRPYVIIDDMVRSGGTMREVAKYLKKSGVPNVYALFAHAAFEPAATRAMSEFKSVWTTNTCGDRVPPDMVKVDFTRHLY